MFTEEDMINAYARGYSEGTEDGVKAVLALLAKRITDTKSDSQNTTDLVTCHLLSNLYRDLIEDIQKNISG